MRNRNKKHSILGIIAKEIKRQKKIKELEEDYAFGVDCWKSDEYLNKIEDEIKRLKRRR